MSQESKTDQLPDQDAFANHAASPAPQAVSVTAPPWLAHEAHPQRIGPYRVLELIGEGGMGSVYKAEQRSPVRRIVAIKVVKPGFDTREVIARFESERQALARMDHPHVAKVLDAGATEQGRSYFVMEYVPGVPITRFCDDNRLLIEQRLQLFLTVCDAIAHAHTKAIIHRDIKPSNVLAHLHDGRHNAKVIDFGIAKALTGDRLTDLTFNTNRGSIVGTFDSMSPEQADGSPDIDIRTDVYSLGVLLYELLVGVKPLDSRELRAASIEDARRIITETETLPPSRRLRALGETGRKIAQFRQLTPAQLTRMLQRELELIPLKAAHRQREQRYANVGQLAEDVRRYLDNQPLAAGPMTRRYVVRKWFLRNQPYVLVAGIASLLTLLGVLLFNLRALPVPVVAALGTAALLAPILVELWLRRRKAEELLADVQQGRSQAESKLRRAQQKSSDLPRQLTLAVQHFDEVIGSLERAPELYGHREAVARIANASFAFLSELFDAAGTEVIELAAFRRCFAGLARVYLGIGEFGPATVAARRALVVLQSAIANGSNDTTLRFERAGTLEMLGNLCEQQGDIPQAIQHYRDATEANQEIYQSAQFEVGPLCNLLRLHLKLHVICGRTSGGETAQAFQLQSAGRAAANLKRLQDRGARLPDETPRLLEHLRSMLPAESVASSEL